MMNLMFLLDIAPDKTVIDQIQDNTGLIVAIIIMIVFIVLAAVFVRVTAKAIEKKYKIGRYKENQEEDGPSEEENKQ